MRRLGKRARNRWFLIRYDTLVNEGFTPEEANLISNAKISSPAVRRVRRIRKAMVQSYQNNGYSFVGAIEKTREAVRKSTDEIVTWDQYRRVIY